MMYVLCELNDGFNDIIVHNSLFVVNFLVALNDTFKKKT